MTNEEELINLVLLDTRVVQSILDRLHGLAEEIHVELLGHGMGERLREVATAFEESDFEAGELLVGHQSSTD